ncbi:MAG: 50S ribosomal protein L29 [Nanoarchaeota archaeon]|nr:50S ribosomal protein L29 [Nanoarchaeota archaeon]
MKKRDIQKMTIAELDKKQKEIELELLKINTKKSSGAPPENPGQIKQLRKTIARIQTRKRLEKKTA